MPRLTLALVQPMQGLAQGFNLFFGGRFLVLKLLQRPERFLNVVQRLFQFAADLFHLPDRFANAGGRCRLPGFRALQLFRARWALDAVATVSTIAPAKTRPPRTPPPGIPSATIHRSGRRLFPRRRFLSRVMLFSIHALPPPTSTPPA